MTNDGDDDVWEMSDGRLAQNDVSRVDKMMFLIVCYQGNVIVTVSACFYMKCRGPGFSYNCSHGAVTFL
jgi:hypothetical protein